MRVKECMTTKVELGNPNMSLSEAAKKMRDGDFGVLPIGHNDRLVGMVTDRDIAIRAVAEGRDPNRVQVGEVMSEGVLYCYEDDDLDDVVRNLGTSKVRRLPVLNRQKRLVGIVSLGDVAQTDEDPLKVEAALCEISKAAPGHDGRVWER